MKPNTPHKTRTALDGNHLGMLEQARMRLVFMGLLLLMGYTAIGFRLVDLTLIKKPVVQVTAAEKENIKFLQKPLRGQILDRNGDVIAASLKMASLYANATMIENAPALAKKLSSILGSSVDDLQKKLSSDKQFIWLARNITPRQQYAINNLGEPALGFQEEDRRMYPNGNLAAHVTGYTDLDGNGIAGIEKYFDRQLAAGQTPVQLTLDLRVQHILHRELMAAVEKFSAKAGIGMVMDANNGEVIAMVSLPDFDPNTLNKAKDDQKFNRTTLGVFEMGSTFKLFSTAAALDSGLVHFGDVFDATNPIKQGRFTISDFHAKKRPLTVPEIFIYSSNIGTAKMAATIGNDKLQDFYRKMGFMSKAGIELPERGTPLYPNPWRDISTLTTSFGHGIAVTPLHLVRAAAALVNGGVMHPAKLTFSNAPADEGTRVISEKTSAQLRQLLELVVTDGSGNNAHVDGYQVGGKTGTAEKNSVGGYNKNSLFSSFLGIYPITNPRYVVLAILDEPQGIPATQGFATGGWTGAPVVARVIEQMAPLYKIEPDYSRTSKMIEREMGVYLKELKDGGRLADSRTDH